MKVESTLESFCSFSQKTEAVMGLVRLRNRKMAYFCLRIRIITVCLLRIRTRRGALLEVLAFVRLRPVSVPINAHKFVRTSDGTCVYAYDKRMCYFDTLIEQF